jgi:NAD(P)-dependent dehydrogenase (short-subunit alcohol dehydrogenase family)
MAMPSDRPSPSTAPSPSQPKRRWDVSGKTILITGASSGLGAHFAAMLATEGAQLVLAGRRVERLEDLAKHIAGQGLALPQVVAMDVADEISIKAAFAVIDAAGTKLDVIINNAGIAEAGAALDLDGAGFDRVLDTNLRGVFLVATQAAMRWRDTGRAGIIVNIASILGERVAGGVAPYAASKAAVIQLTKALALEWARHRIRVNALAPGYIGTQINGEFFATEAGQAMVKRIPMRRLGEPSELDGPLLLLCSDASSFMTGTVIVADGGHLVSSL